MELEHVIEIDAPPDRVWEVTVDVERWPEWTPTVESAKRLDSGAFAVGSSALLKQPGIPEATWTVTDLTPGQQFTWESQVWSMHMSATHELKPLDGGTRNMLRIEVTGLTATLLWPLIRSRLQKALAQENAGLKRHCEKTASPRS